MELTDEEKREQEFQKALIEVLEKLTGGPVPQYYHNLKNHPKLMVGMVNGKLELEHLDIMASFDQNFAVFHELTKVSGSHRSLIVTTNSFIEAMATELAKENCQRPDKVGNMEHSEKILLLFEKGLISEPLYERMDRLNNLRNKAAHRFLFAVPEKWLTEYQAFVPEPSNDIHKICATLLIDIFKAHELFFFEKFSPHMAEFFAWQKKHAELINKLMKDRTEMDRLLAEIQKDKAEGAAKATAAIAAKKKPAANEGQGGLSLS